MTETLVEYIVKKCSRCGEHKLLIFFRKNLNYKDGFFCRCMDCDRAVNRESYKRHSAERVRNAVEYARTHKEQVKIRVKRWNMKPENVIKNKERYQRYNEKNPDAVRNRTLKREYGIDLNTYLQMYNEQGGLCAICRELCAVGKLCVDHDHTNNEVRGLLCRTCNSGLGLLGDTVELIEKTLSYLNKNKEI